MTTTQAAPTHTHKNMFCRAFSIFELSISIAIIGMMLSGTLVVMSNAATKTQESDSKEKLEDIVAALEAYQARRGHLPCPASRAALPGSSSFGKQVNSGDCTYTSAPAGTSRIETSGGSGIWVVVGVVPVRDLLLSDEYLNDGFGNRYTYAVDQRLTEAATFSSTYGAITINDGAGNNIVTDGAYVVLSHGKTGEGGYRYASGAQKSACGATNLDIENCDADVTYSDTAFNDGQVAASFFDDYIRWRSADYFTSTIPATSYLGVTAGNYTSWPIASGDINNDGFDDMIVGAWQADPSGRNNAGSAYVIFGKATGWASSMELSSLNGTNGVRFDGVAAGDGAGHAVGSGDINGDGYDDVMIGSAFANSSAGAGFVVFGKASGWTATVELSSLNGTTGFRLNGGEAGAYAMALFSSGDINGDGYDEVVTGSTRQDFSGRWDAGQVWVLFGKASGWAATIALPAYLNGTTGFALGGAAVEDVFGNRLAVGDVNGDYYDDLIMNALYGDPGGVSSAGSTYVVFGKASSWAASADIATFVNGTNGFRLDGQGADDRAGRFVASGDVNGDGYDDIVAGAPYASPGGVNDAGSTYVVFGKASGWASTIALSSLNGTTGFRLDGVGANDISGWAAFSGDINNDGYDDVIVGAYQADPNGRANAGSTYVVFGKASGWASTIALSSLNGTNGFRVDGAAAGDYFGYITWSSDLNNDDNPDLLIGAYAADPGGRVDAGNAYAVFGKADNWSASYDISDLLGQ